MSNSLKIKGAVLLMGIVLGILIPKASLKPPEKLQVEQKQQQDCKVVIREKIKPDGSIERKTEVQSQSAQAQSVFVGSKRNKLNSLSLVNDELSYAYKLYENDLFSAGPLGQVRKDGTARLGIQINW